MSGLMSRAAVLTASRLSNFAIQLFSPLLLVRILEGSQYGQYQEFMIYAMLLTGLCSFAVDSSLTYFLPRFPERERRLVSQASMITLAISLMCVIVLWIAKPLILKHVSYDFVAPLAAYVFCFVNLNWAEYYWIAKRRMQIVLFYTGMRLLIRVCVLLLVAYVTRDLATILWSLVAVEATRLLLTLGYFAARGVLVFDMRLAEIMEQLQFAGPIGAAALTQNAGRSIGRLFVASTLGPSALAYYATGSYLQPVVRVMRKGIEDAVYPDLVRKHSEPGGALRLWQRVNVLNFAMFAPAFVILVFFAKEIVTTLFTHKYVAAVPVFQVFAFFLVRRCFNTDVLLRTTGRSGFMLWGAVGAVVINVGLIALLAPTLGLVGPAIAFMTAEVILELYFVSKANRAFGLRIRDLADWRNITRIAIGCIAGAPVLLAAKALPGAEILRIAIGSALYFGLSLYVAHRLGVSDVGRVAGFVRAKLPIPFASRRTRSS